MSTRFCLLCYKFDLGRILDIDTCVSQGIGLSWGQTHNQTRLSFPRAKPYSLVSYPSPYSNPSPFQNEVPRFPPTILPHFDVVGSLQLVVIFVPLGFNLIM